MGEEGALEDAVEVEEEAHPPPPAQACRPGHTTVQPLVIASRAECTRVLRRVRWTHAESLVDAAAKWPLPVTGGGRLRTVSACRTSCALVLFLMKWGRATLCSIK